MPEIRKKRGITWSSIVGLGRSVEFQNVFSYYFLFAGVLLLGFTFAFNVSSLSVTGGAVAVGEICEDCPSALTMPLGDTLENAIDFKENGDVVLSGILNELNPNPQPTADDEFIYEDSTGNPVAIVNLRTGNMIIKGNLFENQPSLNPSASSNDFIVENSDGIVASYIDESGNFYLRGSLNQQVIEEVLNCTDSDGGKNYYVKGSVFNFEDSCYSNNLGLRELSCSDTPAQPADVEKDPSSYWGSSGQMPMGSTINLFQTEVEAVEAKQNSVVMRIGSTTVELYANEPTIVDNFVVEVKSFSSTQVEVKLTERYMRRSYFTCPNGCQDGACLLTVGIPLVKGTNLIGIPVRFETIMKASDLGQQIANQGGEVNSISKWNRKLGRYDSWIPVIISSDFEIKEGQGYSIDVKIAPKNNVWKVGGLSFTESIPLDFVAGLNLFSVPFMTSEYNTKSFAQAVQDAGYGLTSIDKWDAKSQSYISWNASSPNENVFDMDTKSGYFIAVTGTNICTDSDKNESYPDGKNYYEKGKVTGPLVSGPDSPNEDICAGSDVRELFCNEEGKGEPFLYTCPIGCKDGACIKINEACQTLLDKAKATFGTTCGDSNYDYIADVNNDKVVDVLDYTTIINKSDDAEWCTTTYLVPKNPCEEAIPVETQDQIDIIVDSNTYSNLESEINRFKEDIERDTGYRVKILADDWAKPSQVRNVLVDDFTNNLIGAILVGDIPITYHVTEYLGQRYPSTPSDYYYQRLKDKDWFEETEDTIFQNLDQRNRYSRDIWTGRLLPPGNNFDEKINLLRKYFNRNHDYRIGKINYDGMLFVESDEKVYEDGNIAEELNEQMSKVATYTGLYADPSKVEVAYALDHEERKNSILNKISNNYEIMSINIHGAPTYQAVGGNVNINKNDIINHPPGSLFVAIESCSNGDIRSKEYFAGWYLFSGNSLLVRANSVITFYVGFQFNNLDIFDEYKLVANGVDFGTIYKNSNGGQQSLLLGDPTLTIREKDLENGPRIDDAVKTIDLGDIDVALIERGDVLATVEIKNIGKSKLELTDYTFGRDWLDDETHNNGVLRIIPATKSILPGESTYITIEMSDIANIGTGRYTQYVSYYTNDPTNPYFKVVVNANFVRSLEILANPISIPADDQSFSSITATTPDSKSDVVISFSSSRTDDTLTSPTCITTADGICSTTVKSLAIGTSTITASAPGYSDGTTIVSFTEPKPKTNNKDMSKYSDKEVFLISDANWKDVLSLVPLTTWTDEREDINKYPTLIYHEEGNAFDVDSIIYFMQQYSAEKVAIVGSTTQELDNLLVAAPELGAGVEGVNIKRISANDYLSHWEFFKDVVYVEDNYELALMASTYASLINAPLVIQGTSLDSETVFENRNVICVGNVGAHCSEAYTLEQLQQKYVDETNTDKIILVNPNDLGIKVDETFQPKKSGSSINELYSRTSLAAPILASAKHELIISTTSTDYSDVDSFIENKIESLNKDIAYLTIMASPDAIEMYTDTISTILASNYRRTVDSWLYGNMDEDDYVELFVGRLFGISISDVSSYVTRSVFYDELNSLIQKKTIAGSYDSNLGGFEGTKSFFNNAIETGYSSKLFLQDRIPFDPLPTKEDFEDVSQGLYLAHGYTGGFGGFLETRGRSSSVGLNELDSLFPGIFANFACDTCRYSTTSKANLFCTNMIRKGVMAYMGAVSLNYGFDDINQPHMLLYLISNQKKSIGEAWRIYMNEPSPQADNPFVLLADPTLVPNLDPIFNWQPPVEHVDYSTDKAVYNLEFEVPSSDYIIAYPVSRSIHGVRGFGDPTMLEGFYFNFILKTDKNKELDFGNIDYKIYRNDNLVNSCTNWGSGFTCGDYYFLRLAKPVGFGPQLPHEYYYINENENNKDYHIMLRVIWPYSNIPDPGDIIKIELQLPVVSSSGG